MIAFGIMLKFKSIYIVREWGQMTAKAAWCEEAKRIERPTPEGHPSDAELSHARLCRLRYQTRLIDTAWAPTRPNMSGNTITYCDGLSRVYSIAADSFVRMEESTCSKLARSRAAVVVVRRS
jgi:hypothetical protein